MALVSLGLVACVPDFTDDTSRIREPRLLAVQHVPPELPPGSSVTTAALWATPEGGPTDAPLDWAFCTARKTLTETGPVASRCLVPDGEDLIGLGEGLSVSGTLPADACRRFGSDRPDPEPGETAARPADPDGTGGYYQPLRVLAGTTINVAQVRIRCGLPDATPEQSVDYANGYVANANPVIARSTLDGVDLGAPDVVTPVRPDARVTFELGWDACEAAPCGGSEPYLWFDPAARTLRTRREAIRVSWYATAGSFDASHTGRAENEREQSSTSNVWTAPSESGPVFVWAVMRDDRGGATWATYHLDVSP